jgi:hypothetical protein
VMCRPSLSGHYKPLCSLAYLINPPGFYQQGRPAKF